MCQSYPDIQMQARADTWMALSLCIPRAVAMLFSYGLEMPSLNTSYCHQWESIHPIKLWFVRRLV